jgi:hypothetical protein
VKNLAVLTLCLAMFLIMMPAKAATIIATYNGELFSSTIDRSLNSGGTFTNVKVGVFDFTRTGGTYAGFVSPSTEFLAFCIEPGSFITPGASYTYTVDTLADGPTSPGPMGATKADELRELYGRYWDFTTPLTTDLASALEIATWEIVRETTATLDPLAGSIQFKNPSDAAALTLAQSMLASIDGTGPKITGDLALLSPSSVVGAEDPFQDVVVRELPTPEPASALLIGAGLLGLAALRRRVTN